MATIKEIAAMAGVSPTTVSNVIHGKLNKVSEEKEKRVRKIIDELNFAPNLAASILAHNSTHIVGIVLNYDSRDGSPALQDPYASAVVGVLEDELKRHGYYSMLYASVEFDKWLQLSSTWNMAGLIVLGVSYDKAQKLREKSKVPVVFIDSYLEDDGKNDTDEENKKMPFYNVGLEDYKGGFDMTSMLIEKGHKSIVFLADRDIPKGVDAYRLMGVKKALEKNGLDSENCYIATSRNREERLQKVYEVYESNRYTAMFFSSDYYASESIHFLESKGVRIPEDISIVGFDDNDFSILCCPQITTVHQDTKNKGAEAVKLLVKVIGNEVPEECVIRLKTRIVERESVKIL